MQCYAILHVARCHNAVRDDAMTAPRRDEIEGNGIEKNAIQCSSVQLNQVRCDSIERDAIQCKNAMRHVAV